MDLIKERATAIALRLTEEHPDRFPSSRVIAKLLSEKYGIRTEHKKVLELVDIEYIQIKWIENCPSPQFLKALTSRSFYRVKEPVKDAIKKRFFKLVSTVIIYSDKIPTYRSIARLMEQKYGVALSHKVISYYFTLSELHEFWLERISDEDFARSVFSRRQSKKVDSCKLSLSRAQV